MKPSIISLLSLAILIGCSVPPGVNSEEELAQEKLNRPQTVFEGVWLWMKTEGEGIAGPYMKDSVSEGHSIRYDFYDMTNLQVYFNDEKQLVYNYSFTIGDGEQNNTLTLENKQAGSALAEHYFWEIEELGEDTYLYLKNTEPCCDNTFTQYYKLIKRHELNGSL